jgi:hypothetical protein
MSDDGLTEKEDLTELPGFPQEIAWAVSALTYLTDEERWPAFFAYIQGENGFADPTVGSEEIKEIAIWASHKLHSVGHSMVERRKAMMDLPPFLRQMMGMPVDDSELEDGPENDEPERPGQYL